MEPPPAPPFTAVPPPPLPHLAYPDSLDSSPRSRNSWDDSTLHSSKLRLMCSYGGHIMPRPHDKSLCYVGGDTRIVVLDRRTTLSDFTDRLSKSLRHSQTFILKYQLPNEDLDSLISITSDEDLENMIDEYDRLASTKTKSSRLRIFLFPAKPDSGSSIGSLIGNSTKSGEWFLNALNGGATTNPGFSDSLLSFDDDTLIGPTVNSSVDPPNAKGVINSTHAMPEQFVSEMLSSSSGSASSSPAIATLPTVRAHGEDHKVGIEDQLVQMTNVVPNIPDTGGFVGLVATAPMSYPPVTGDHKHSEYVLPQKQTCSFDLLSPDSVSSDGSLTNQLSRQKTIIYQDPILQISRSSSNPIEPNIADSNSTRIVQMQDYGYLLHSQMQQQQFIQGTGNQYIPNRPPASYYPFYPPNQHHIRHTPIDQHHQVHQYNPSAVYYMPAKQAQLYNEATPKPDVGSVPYRTASTGAQQYVGFSPMNLSGNAINYGPDFGEPMQAHLYYNRGVEPKEQNVKQQQPVRTTSQP